MEKWKKGKGKREKVEKNIATIFSTILLRDESKKGLGGWWVIIFCFCFLSFLFLLFLRLSFLLILSLLFLVVYSLIWLNLLSFIQLIRPLFSGHLLITKLICSLTQFVYFNHLFFFKYKKSLEYFLNLFESKLKSAQSRLGQ